MIWYDIELQLASWSMKLYRHESSMVIEDHITIGGQCLSTARQSHGDKACVYDLLLKHE